MSVSMRFRPLAPAGVGVLGVLALLTAAPFAGAQPRPSINAGAYYRGYGRQMASNYFRLNFSQAVPPQSAANLNLNQWARNVATVGGALAQVPPYALGYNPYPSAYASISAYNPSLSGGYGYGGGNPYYGGGNLTTDPYGGGGAGLSTWGGYPSYSPYGAYGGLGLDPSYGTLRGWADLTVATGKYWRDIQQARITREQSRVAAMDTNKRRIQDEAEYERMRPTALTLLDKWQKGDREWARRFAPKNDIWSGRALNVLLGAINDPKRGDLNTGPTIDLSEDTLKNINMTTGAGKGNISLIKDPSNIAWPRALRDKIFDEVRARLTRKLRLAVDEVKDVNVGKVERGTLNDLEGDYDTLNSKLGGSVRDFTPSQYIDAKRFLNQLKAGIQALGDPRAAKYFGPSRAARGKTVSELVRNMRKDGLQFAPATPGEEASYTALYQALRAFDARLPTSSK
jgi:hypothetical protein